MLKNPKSKFSYITYPFFGRYEVPIINVEFNKISAIIRNNEKILKVGNSSNFLEELLSFDIDSKEKRVKFQVTAKSTQELLMLDKKCNWGVDITGKFHDLSRLEKFPKKTIKPVKITKDKYIWFRDITRPVISPLSIKNIKDDILYYWFSFLYIDNVWELSKILPYPIREEFEWI